MQLMVEGDKWEMYIPYELAYGEQGSPPKIPGKSALVFTMEIIEVKGEGKSVLNSRILFQLDSDLKDDPNVSLTNSYTFRLSKFPT